MNIQQAIVIIGSLLIFGGSIGAVHQTILAGLYLVANIIIFVLMR